MVKLNQIDWYRLVDWMGHKRGLYRATFEPAHAKALLYGDLAKFCRAFDPILSDDPSVRDVLLGRREVWLHIQKYLNTPTEELVHLLTGAELEGRSNDGN